MTEADFETLTALRYRIFGAQRDLIERCGGYKRVMDKTGKSKSEVGRWFGGADQDFMPPLAVYQLERDCGFPLITSVMAEANGRRLTDPEEDKLSQVNLHRAYAETVRKRAEVDTVYAAAIEDGDISAAEAIAMSRALTAQDRANADLHGAVSVVKARGGSPATLKVVE